MQPLPRETTVFQYPEARCFIIFPCIFQDKFWNRHFIDFRSNFGHLRSPFGDLWLHFWGHVFRSQKSQNIVLVSAPGARPSVTNLREGGNWEASGRHLRGIWGARGQRRPGGGSGGKCAKTIVFFCQKWRDRPFRVHESVVTLTVYRACA